jgi:hypothetical protein
MVADSVFVDQSVSPKVFFHGTGTGADFNIFAYTDESSIGFHFGSLDAARKRISNMICEEGECEAVIPVICCGSNPPRLTDRHT